MSSLLDHFSLAGITTRRPGNFVKTRHRTKLIWALGLSLASWLILAGGSRVFKSVEAIASQAQNPQLDLTSRSQATEQTFAELAVKAQTEGRVRVIVGLRTAFETEGTLSSAAEVQTQRLGIAEAQNTLLDRMTAYNAASVKQFSSIPFLALEVDAAGLQHLRASSDVVTVQEDIAVPPSLAESVPLIGAPAAWASGFTGAGQTVAILDTGVDKSHPFLSGKVVSEACYSTTDANSVSVCPGGVAQSTAPGSAINCALVGCDHGTHVAGIAAGKSASFSGVAKDAQIIAIQVFSQINSPNICGKDPVPCLRSYLSDQILGLQRVQALSASRTIAAVNLSLSGDPVMINCDATALAMKVAIDNLRSVGIATIAASGNEGSTSGISLPACISTAISVGATGDGSLGALQDVVSSFSNSASSLTLLAPGQWIRSSVPGGGFANKQGTSMAAPHVTGAWAVLKSKSPNATVPQILSALTSTGLPVLDPRNGLIKPRIALDAAINALSCTASLAPTNQSFSSSGGTGTVEVAPSCCWTASSNANWIMLTTGSSGCGNKAINYSVSANPNTTSRIGTITIAGLTFTVRQAGVCVLTPISLGQTINGTLSTNDCRSPVKGSTFYADRYTFTATAGQAVSLALSSTDFDTYLYLIGPNGALVAQDDDGGGNGTNSQIPPISGRLNLPTSGTYIIEVTSFRTDNTGNYTLRLIGCSFSISPASQNFASNGGQGSVNVAASSGCAWTASSNANWITVTSATSVEPATCLQVVGLGCGQGQGTVSYSVATNLSNTSRTGTVSVAGQVLTVTQAGNPCAITPIGIGQTKTGSLSPSDCRSPIRGSVYFADRYTFNAVAGQRVAILLTSSVFDTYLYLIGPNGTVVNQNDNGDGGMNSRIPAGLGFFMISSSGTYTIEVTSSKTNGIGNYLLSLFASQF